MEDNKIKLCPIKGVCVKNSCMWYDAILEKCAVMGIADELFYLRKAMEDNYNDD